MNSVWPKRIPFSPSWQLSWLALGLLLSPPAWGHGVEASWRAVPTFEIQARYDSGEPMRFARVTVFAPTNPTLPWQEGETDGEGRFWLQPDPELKGLWQVRIRQAGHGGVVNVPVGEEGMQAEGIPRPSSPGFGPLQRGVMAACVIWGCLGTALFFSRPRPFQGPELPDSPVDAAALSQD
jgi:nickel transport protein